MAPYYTIELQPDYDFKPLLINCVPLNGLTYNTDDRKIHKIIRGFVLGETAETWINTKERKQYGQLDFIALLYHYGGESNKAVWIKESEELRTLLIYKNERAM